MFGFKKPTEDDMALSFTASFMSWLCGQVSDEEITNLVANLEHLLDEASPDDAELVESDFIDDVVTLTMLHSMIPWLRVDAERVQNYRNALARYFEVASVRAPMIVNDLRQLLIDIDEELSVTNAVLEELDDPA